MENIFLTSLTTPEVRQLFRQELQSFFQDTKPFQPLQSEVDPLLTIEEAATFAHLSKATIYGLVSRSEVPCMKKGKRLYFSRQELTEWIKAGRKKTVSEIAADTDSYLTRKAR